MHRILCCSDTHGAVPPPRDEAGALCWLHAGDLCNGRDPQLNESVRTWFADRAIPMHLVRGNHDVVDLYHAFKLHGDLSGRMIQIADHLFVAGVGWCGEKWFELPCERDLEPICQSIIRQGLRQLFSKDRLILLTHYPPRFPQLHHVENDKDGAGIWYDCVRSVVELLEPLAVIQGHVHQWFNETHRVKLAKRETLLVNPGAGGCEVLVDMEQDNASIK